jgi:hypothetical protein
VLSESRCYPKTANGSKTAGRSLPLMLAPETSPLATMTEDCSFWREFPKLHRGLDSSKNGGLRTPQHHAAGNRQRKDAPDDLLIGAEFFFVIRYPRPDHVACDSLLPKDTIELRSRFKAVEICSLSRLHFLGDPGPCSLIFSCFLPYSTTT